MRGVTFNDALDGVPCFAIHNRVAVIFDCQVTEFQDADIDRVSEKCCVRIEGVEQTGVFLDLAEGCSSGAHFKRLADAWNKFWIGFPAVGDVFGFVAAITQVDGDAPEAGRGDARDTSKTLHQVTQSAFRFD